MAGVSASPQACGDTVPDRNGAAHWAWTTSHVAADDHSRYAYVEALADERGATTAASWSVALAYYRARGLEVRELLTDNAKSYTAAHAFLAVAAVPGLRRRTTRP